MPRRDPCEITTRKPPPIFQSKKQALFRIPEGRRKTKFFRGTSHREGPHKRRRGTYAVAEGVTPAGRSGAPEVASQVREVKSVPALEIREQDQGRKYLSLTRPFQFTLMRGALHFRCHPVRIGIVRRLIQAAIGHPRRKRRTSSDHLNFGSQLRLVVPGNRQSAEAAQPPVLSRIIRSMTSSTRTIRRNHHSLRGDNGPSNALLLGGRNVSRHAWDPSSLSLKSTSISPRLSASALRSFCWSWQPG